MVSITFNYHAYNLTGSCLEIEVVENARVRFAVEHHVWWRWSDRRGGGRCRELHIAGALRKGLDVRMA